MGVLSKTTIKMKKRLKDLSDRSYRNNQYTFTSFLGMAELSDFYELERASRSKGSKEYDEQYILSKDILSSGGLSPCGYTVFGGYDDAERAVIRFGNPDDLGYEQPFPIACLKIEPLMKKFSDALSHRDFLGALMNLGIERSNIGDILVKDNMCIVFVLESMVDIICHELTRVKHTSVMTRVTEFDNEDYSPNLIPCTLTAKSLRLDSFIAKAYNLSRNDAAGLFVTSKVFVNGRLMSNESAKIKEDDVITVRGYGKLIFKEISGNTRKGNIIISYLKYS